MKDSEKLVLFRQYMINKGYEKIRIDYNLKVVTYFINTVLYFLNETLENFDSFTFDEFTDKINLIDEEFGGRDGIKNILRAMLDLTEFLKEYKFIKGGKIAFYKRMFSNEGYYLQKYDTLKGKKSEAKEEIKNVLNADFVKRTLNILEEINCSEFEPLVIIDKLLNDIPINSEISMDKIDYIKDTIYKMDLIIINKTNYEVTKLGRIFSRLEYEQKFAIFLYYLFALKKCSKLEILNNLIHMIITIFNKREAITFYKNEEINNTYIGLSSDEYRINYIENDKNYYFLFDLIFVGCGLIEKKKIGEFQYEYRITDIGRYITHTLILQYNCNSKRSLVDIPYLIKNKEYENAEDKIKKFLIIYGENSIILDLLGQVLLLQRKYKSAYEILIYAYQRANKRSNAFKSIVYHLVLCCRKLKKEEEIRFYEERLLEISSKA